MGGAVASPLLQQSLGFLSALSHLTAWDSAAHDRKQAVVRESRCAIHAILKPVSCLSFPSSWDYGDTLPLPTGKQTV